MALFPSDHHVDPQAIVERALPALATASGPLRRSLDGAMEPVRARIGRAAVPA